MIRVYKSDTGQYVLVNEPTQTVIIDENLEAAFTQMQEHVRLNNPDLLKKLYEPFEAHKERPSFPGLAAMKPGLLLAIAAAPFLWLVVLHFTIASIADDVIDYVRGRSVPAAEEVRKLQADMQELKSQLSRLGQDKQAAAIGPEQIKAETKPLADAQAQFKAELEKIRLDLANANNQVGAALTQIETLRKSQPAVPAPPN